MEFSRSQSIYKWCKGMSAFSVLAAYSFFIFLISHCIYFYSIRSCKKLVSMQMVECNAQGSSFRFPSLPPSHFLPPTLSLQLLISSSSSSSTFLIFSSPASPSLLSFSSSSSSYCPFSTSWSTNSSVLSSFFLPLYF